MNKMKKLVALLLAMVMVLSMVGCGNGGNDDKETQKGGDPVVEQTKGEETPTEPDYSKYEITEEVTIQFWHNYSNAQRTKWLEDQAAAYNESQDKVTVEVVYIGGYPAIAEQIAGCMAAGGKGLPGLSTINVPRVLNFAGSGIIEDLDEYYAAWGLEDGYFLEGMLDGVSDKDGNVSALPFGISAGVCIYNKTLLDELNLPFPETWEEFKTWAKAVTEKTGNPAFAFPYDFNYMNTFFLNVTGVDPLGDGSVSVLDNPAIISFVQDLKDLVDAGYCTWVGATVNGAQDDQQAAFNSKLIAAYTDTSSGLQAVIKNAEFEVGACIGVTGTGNPARTTTSGASLIMFSANDQQVNNAAFDFAVYLCEAERHASWAADTCMFPVTYAELDSDVLDAMYEQYPGVKDVFDESANVIGKNKSTAMQAAMEEVVGVLGQYLKGEISKDNFDSAWGALKKNVDTILADAQ